MKRWSAAAGRTISLTVIFVWLPATGRAQANLPSIKSGGVVSASSFGQFTSIAPGSWIEIYGSSLASTTRSWTATDFSGVNAPTSLDGTKVSVGGQPAFIDYVSPGQVNAQVPSNVAVGSQPIVVTTPSGSSAPYTITVNATQPGLLAPSSFKIGGTQYAAALFSDGTTFVLPPGSIPGLQSKRAQPSDTITFYGIGFGGVVPSISAGQIVGQSNTLASNLQINFGTAMGMLTYDGLAPSAVGLYQFNVVVPSIASSDSVPLSFNLGGAAGTQTLYLAIQGSSPTPQVQSLNLSSSSVAGGATVQGTVTLSSAAPPGGAVIALTSSASVVSFPGSVTVPAGALSATFSVSASSVISNQSVTITASYGGNSTQASLTVTGSLSTTVISSPAATCSTAAQQVTCPILIVVGSVMSGGISMSLVPPGVGPAPIVVQANFSSVFVSGLTYTLSGLQPANSSMRVLGGASYTINSASMTVLLRPTGTTALGMTGALSGSFTLTSDLMTLSGTISGAYSAMGN